MGREVRRVPKDWDHPEDSDERYIALLDGFDDDVEEWDNRECSPDQEDYMPDWPESERTHYQMYETTSEGTPISPVMESPEELARWLVDNRACTFADMTASYEQWLAVCLGKSAPSMIVTKQNGGSDNADD